MTVLEKEFDLCSIFQYDGQMTEEMS